MRRNSHFWEISENIRLESSRSNPPSLRNFPRESKLLFKVRLVRPPLPNTGAFGRPLEQTLIFFFNL